jgi:hypothetical protein
MHLWRKAAVVAPLAVVLATCGGSDSPDKTSQSSVSTITSTSSAPSTTTSSVPETARGGLAGSDDFVASLVGRTYESAEASGVSAHQQSDVGRAGSWTLFTVERSGRWYAFTTVNPHEADDTGTLTGASKIVTGERLEDLAPDDWYGVAGVVRDGRPIGGVMMHGRGQERQADGTYPVLDAWRVNLQTLRLEPSPTTGLDIVESCG